RSGKVSLKIRGPARDDPPAVSVYIDLTRGKFQEGLNHEPIEFRLPRGFHFIDQPSRVAGFELLPEEPAAAKLPPELDLIPRSAAGFLTVRVREVMEAPSPSLAWCRKQFLGHKKITELVRFCTGMEFKDIVRATVIWPAAEQMAGHLFLVPPEVPSRIIVLTSQTSL